jgi:hypothetical protein
VPEPTPVAPCRRNMRAENADQHVLRTIWASQKPCEARSINGMARKIPVSIWPASGAAEVDATQWCQTLISILSVPCVSPAVRPLADRLSDLWQPACSWQALSRRNAPNHRLTSCRHAQTCGVSLTPSFTSMRRTAGRTHFRTFGSAVSAAASHGSGATTSEAAAACETAAGTSVTLSSQLWHFHTASVITAQGQV